MRNSDKPTLVHVTTVAKSLYFFRSQIEYLTAHGFHVEAISSQDDTLTRYGNTLGIPVHGADMRRSISPFRDLIAIFKLVSMLRTCQPDIVHASTPKGGLLGMIAASIDRRPKRIYHVLGLPYLTARGRRRSLLIASERVSCRLAHRVFCVSASIRELAIRDGICSPEKIVVIGNGSVNGVDAREAYDPARHSTEARIELRRALGLNEDHLLVGFVGRIVRDKGMEDLAAAWAIVSEKVPRAKLLIVGEQEAQDPVSADALAYLENNSSVQFVGQVADPSTLYAIFDLVVLPTHREGFGNVLIEAASMQVPVVASDIPGCVDAVEDQVTGSLVEPHDADLLAFAIVQYLRNPTRRRKHGEAARERVLNKFTREIVLDATLKEYDALLTDEFVAMPSVSSMMRDER